MKILQKLSTAMKASKKVGRVFTGAVLVLSILFATQSCKKDVINPLETNGYQQLRVDMRKLWAEHMEWTYATVDAFYHDQDGLSPKLNRLLLNQQQIGTAIKPYFGEEAGSTLASLLTEHIQLAVPVLTAAQNGDNAALQESLDNWYANAQAVGDHYAAINPENWDQATLRDMWKTHITQTVGYSVALLQNNLDDAIVKYQEAYDHMMGMGDIMAQGIAKKSPSSFQ